MYGLLIWSAGLLIFLIIWFIYPDDQKDPEQVDKDENASLGEESPGTKDGMEGGSEGFQGPADQSVKDAAELWQDFSKSIKF